MQWIAFNHLDATSQPGFLVPAHGSGESYSFCFPGHYTEDFTKQLERLGFQHSEAGLTAPLNFETADALRLLDGAVHVERDSAELELPAVQVKLPPALEHMVRKTPETLPLARQVAAHLVQKDWESFSTGHPSEADSVVDYLSSDFHSELLARGWQGVRGVAWPLSKNSAVITMLHQDAVGLPVYSLHYAGKKVKAVQSLDMPSEIIARFADQRAETAKVLPAPAAQKNSSFLQSAPQQVAMPDTASVAHLQELSDLRNDARSLGLGTVADTLWKAQDAEGLRLLLNDAHAAPSVSDDDKIAFANIGMSFSDNNTGFNWRQTFSTGYTLIRVRKRGHLWQLLTGSQEGSNVASVHEIGMLASRDDAIAQALNYKEQALSRRAEYAQDKETVAQVSSVENEIQPVTEQTPKETAHGTVRQEPARFSSVDDAPDLSDGQRPGESAGIVPDTERGTVVPASQRDDSESLVSGNPAERHAPRRKTGTGDAAPLPSERDQSGRDAADGTTTSGTFRLGGTSPRSVSDDHGVALPAESDTLLRNSRNHRISPEDTLVPGGSTSRITANIAAIRLLKQLQAEGREATPEERRMLTQFTGWGSLAQEVFKPRFDDAAVYEGENQRLSPYIRGNEAYSYAQWKEKYGALLHPALGGLLTRQEWNAAKDSTLNAFYTSSEVVQAMWGMVEKLGFRGGRVLEPSAGTGLFFGLMPEKNAARSDLVGIELDTVTGGILEKLYPDADIQVTGFEEAKRTGDNSVDLVISNFPFGNFSVFDRNRPAYSKQSIHNYFISRSLDAIRPGGLVAAITSHHTLDAATNAKTRAAWAAKADLVGAIRLPETAFKKNAGTEVTTDILLFRKKSETPFAMGQSFSSTVEIETPEGQTTINEYFKNHPEMVLGTHSLTGSMYREKEYTVTPSSESLEEGLRRIMERLPNNVMGEGIASTSVTKKYLANDTQREGSLIAHEGKPFFVHEGELVEPAWSGSTKKVAQALEYVELKRVLNELIQTMNREVEEEPVTRLREELNSRYDTYTRQYGTVTPSRQNSYLMEDLEYPNIAALETLTPVNVEKHFTDGPRKGERHTVLESRIGKADIFSRRTIYPFIMPEQADSLEDAVKISRVYRHGVDVPYIARLTGTTVENTRAELVASGLAFINPVTGLAEARDIYLTGEVRTKLREAEACADENPEYQQNVLALQEVQPARKTIDQIGIRLGTSWLPEKGVCAFLEHLGVRYPSVLRARLEGEDGSTLWQASGMLTPEARNKWGVDGADLITLVQDALNLKRTRVYVDIEAGDTTRREEDKEKSLAAQEKQRELQEAFRSFVKNNDQVAVQIEDMYNERFNGHVARTFDVPDIRQYPGASSDVELRPNQKIAVTRALQESTLLAHGVGTGKTFEQITLAMEMRRLGTARKPWIVVQGSTLSQFAASFKRLYPSARILVPTEKQRTASNRRRLLSQIAMGDWDAVITPHGFFNSVSISPNTAQAFIENQLAECEEALQVNQQSTNEGSRLTVKNIRRRIKTLKAHLEKLADSAKDENIFFEDLGIDALLIDEAHAYKRGSFFTKMDNVKGLDRDASQRSMQLLMKARHVQEKTGGKNVILATGTPISNTLTELWTMFRYIRPDLLKSFNVTQFDDFASTFADTSMSLEETATGDFKMVERFNTYTNGQDLLNMWRCGADIALVEDMNYLNGVPKLQGGKIQEVSVERSEELTNYIRALKAQRDAWDRQSGAEKKEHPSVPLEIYGKAKRAAIDLRLIDASLPDIPESKANKAVKNMLETWKEHSDTRAAQLVFCDNFQSSDKEFNIFEDIKAKLIAEGIPEQEIAIIHDFQTDKARSELFDKTNRGEVRVLMGTTEKLGVGVNVQERLIAVHHIDAPMRPMDFEQRNGRIRRPGNIFPEVGILTYGTRNTLDSVIFQQLISKQKFINQVLRGNVAEDTFDNPFDEVQATFEDMLAAFSGNPLAKEKMKLQAEIRRLQSLKSAHSARLAGMRYRLRTDTYYLEQTHKTLATAQKVTAYLESCYPDEKIQNRKEIAQKIGIWLEQAGNTIKNQLKNVNSLAQWQVCNPRDYIHAMRMTLPGDLKLEIMAYPAVDQKDNECTKDVVTAFNLHGPFGINNSSVFSGATGLLTRIENTLDNEKTRPERILKEQQQIKANMTSLQHELEEPFQHEQTYKEAQVRMEEIEKALAEAVNEDLEIGKEQLEENNEEKPEPQLTPEPEEPEKQLLQGYKEQWDKLEKDIKQSIAIIHGIDENIPSCRSYNRSLFVSSIAGKITTLAKNGQTSLVRQALDYLRDAQSDMTKPLFTPRHSIWSLLAETQQTIEKETALSAESQREIHQTASEEGTDTSQKTLSTNDFTGVYSDILNHLRNTANETDTDAEEAQLAPM